MRSDETLSPQQIWYADAHRGTRALVDGVSDKLLGNSDFRNELLDLACCSRRLSDWDLFAVESQFRFLSRRSERRPTSGWCSASIQALAPAPSHEGEIMETTQSSGSSATTISSHADKNESEGGLSGC